ncbi:MAG TPA: hypothetical protein VHC22_14280 [Pirellulales bacterium]|nr:hypothetical protein [Pirellulales bacterium]
MAGRFQFSIRFLFLATVVVAAGIAAARAGPAIWTSMATNCLSVVFATAAVLGVYQTTGNVRIFWIGTAMVLCPLAFFAVQHAVLILPYIMAQPGAGMGGYPDYHKSG